MLKLFRVLIVLIVAVKLEPVSSQKEPCEDTGIKCDKFAPEYCQKNKRVMVTCKKSCGLCGPTCNDGIQNQLETDVDCGGPCPACGPTCNDGIQNQLETGVDCGGPCPPCGPTCNDGIQNQLETGVDCGGPCPACAPTCNDGVQNQLETGIDCGGPCPACGNSTCIIGNSTGSPLSIISSRKQQCSTANDDIEERTLFDLSHNCNEFGPDCQLKRDAATKLVSRYNQITEQEKSKKHEWKGILATGISADDPRPNGIDKYIDYLNGETTPNKPPHGFYGKLPTNKLRDPTCNELRKALHGMCGQGDQPLGNWGRNGVSIGQLCGMGTTWNAKMQRCTRIPDEYINIDGKGRPYAQPIYPQIRSHAFKSIFDEPNDKYVYLDEDEINGITSRNDKKCVPTFPGGTCTSDRCRFPLTSKEGQHQAKLYVNLFRMIYEYYSDNPSDPAIRQKLILRGKIRQLIDNHNSWFASGIHGNGDFLPWHRWYILEMETILMEGQKRFQLGQDCSKRFHGIPYFDWHNLKGNQSPRDFINSRHFHDSLGQNTELKRGCIVEGGLARFNDTTGDCLKRSWKIGEEVEEGQDRAESRPEDKLHPSFPLATQYNQFRNRLEHGDSDLRIYLHDSVHLIVGGHMGTSQSANDPIFFTHHGNVDKIWGDWQKQSCDHKNAFDGITAKNSILLASTATPADMLDLDNLIYTTQNGAKQHISVSYVDFDTSNSLGEGNTLSINLP